MAKLEDIMAYVIMNYPIKSELSNARLTKMIYLADWRHAISNDKQVSQISWFFNNFGPYVSDVFDTAQEKPDLFSIIESENAYGKPKKILKLKNNACIPRISPSEKETLDYVIRTTKSLNWNDFINLVYSTFPIISNHRYNYLDLIKLAKVYRKIKGKQILA